LLNASIKPDGDSYTLTLSTLDGLVIYYTADGSTPLPGAKNTSKYTTPVILSAGETDEDGNVNLSELRVVVVDPDGSMDGAVASSYFSNIDEDAIATPEPDKFTASFWSDGGSEVEPQTVYVGEKITEPKDVIKSGYTFDGWFKDELFADKWNFSTDVLNDNVILYAKWLSADIEVLSNYHVIDQANKTIIPDKNSSTGEFIRKLRFPNDSTYKLTLKDGTTEASPTEPVQEGMILSVTAEDGKTAVKYTIKSTTTKSGEVIAPVITPEPTAKPTATPRPTATPKPTATPIPTDTP
ncbi:MAG: InlB B-repeat-containing protein, partial [Candidatus Ornithomonoglobus sp.]